MAGTLIRVAFAQLCVFSEELKVSHPDLSYLRTSHPGSRVPSWTHWLR